MKRLMAIVVGTVFFVVPGFAAENVHLHLSGDTQGKDSGSQSALRGADSGARDKRAVHDGSLKYRPEKALGGRAMKESGEKGGTTDMNIGVGE